MSQSRVDDLLDALCANSLTDAEQAELDALIISDSAIAKQVARMLDLNRDLADQLRPSSQRLPINQEEANQRQASEERPTTRRIRSRPRRSARTSLGGRVIAIASAIAALIAVVLLLNHPAKPERWLEGSADFISGGPITTGQQLQVGAQLVTTGKAAICFADGTRVRLAVGSRVTIGEGPGKRLHLDHGRLLAQVAKQGERDPFRVHTAHAQVTVVGTVFDLVALGARSELSVQEGSVRLQAAGIDTMVTAGQHRVVDPTPPVAEPQVADPAPKEASAWLVRRTAVWAYRDLGDAPDAGWLQPGFDDRAWLRGPAPLGYDRNDDRSVFATRINAEDPEQLTTWFRHEFTCEEPGKFTRLLLHLQRDDGAIIYLNGQELLRDNLPSGPLTAQTSALTRIDGKKHHDGEVSLLWVVPASGLRAGRNCIAAQVHQYKTSSTDLLFSLEVQADSRSREPVSP